jgi:diguanylate cyclase (GGDEF)-like protein
LNLESVLIVLLLVVTIISVYEYKLIKFHRQQLNNCETVRKKLFETNEMISKTNDEDKIYSIVLDTIMDIIPNATNGSILIYNNEDDKFYFKVVKGFAKDLVSLSIKKEESYLFKINGFKETAIINKPGEFDRNNVNKETIDKFEKINALDIYCTLSAPIYVDNHFIGLLNVDTNIPEHEFSERDLYMLNQIKCELELAIKNALAQTKLKYLANYDELTGLANRRMLKKEFDKEVEAINYKKAPFSVVMIDLDNFKFFNDKYGHQYGDMVLKKFTELLRNSVRKSDIVARLAGDEFVIIFKDLTKEMAEIKMEQISKVILTEEFNGVILGFSYGIFEVKSKDIGNFDKVLAHADAKMYENKKVKV